MHTRRCVKDRRALNLLATLRVSGETRFHPSGSHVQVTRKRHKRPYGNTVCRERMKIIWKRYGDDVYTDGTPDVSRFLFFREGRREKPCLSSTNLRNETQRSDLIEGLKVRWEKKKLHLTILIKSEVKRKLLIVHQIAWRRITKDARGIRRFCAR